MKLSLRAIPVLLFQGSGLPCAVDQVREGQTWLGYLEHTINWFYMWAC